jgi:magnesium transporter
VRLLTAFDRAQIDDLRASSEFFWLDLVAPSDDELTELAEALGISRLVLEDLREPNQRPKLDDYPDHVLLVYYGAKTGKDGRPYVVEVDMVVSGDYVVTSASEPWDAFDHVRKHLANIPPRNEAFVVYKILDTLTDTFFPMLERLDDQIDELEDAVLTDADSVQLKQLHDLKRDLVVLRRVVSPQRDLFARAGDDIISLPGLERDERDLFRDIYDHLIRLSEQIDDYRDLLTGTMDLYQSTVSNRINGVMERLTVISTVFLPLTFIVGFFGQNFGWLTSHIDGLPSFMIWGIGGGIVPTAVLLYWMKRNEWI